MCPGTNKVNIRIKNPQFRPPFDHHSPSPANFLEGGHIFLFMNWVIRCFNILAWVADTAVAGHTCAPDGHTHHVAICLRLKYFINLKWKMEHPIGTYLQVIQQRCLCTIWMENEVFIMLRSLPYLSHLPLSSSLNCLNIAVIKVVFMGLFV